MSSPRRGYPSDLTDAQWALIENLLPEPSMDGRREKHPRREIVNGIQYVVRSGCPWRYLPADLPPWQTVYWYFVRWEDAGVTEELLASPAYAAAAYAAFAGCITLGRLAGDRISAAVAPVTLLRGCGLIAGAGLATGIILGSPIAAVVGFGCLGAGLSCVIPLLYSTAGNLDPGRRGAALSREAALGYLGYVTGPVLIGGAAAQLGLGHTLLILPVLAGLLVAAVPVVRPTPGPSNPSATAIPGRKDPQRLDTST